MGMSVRSLHDQPLPSCQSPPLTSSNQPPPILSVTPLTSPTPARSLLVRPFNSVPPPARQHRPHPHITAAISLSLRLLKLSHVPFNSFTTLYCLVTVCLSHHEPLVMIYRANRVFCDGSDSCKRHLHLERNKHP